VFLGVDPDSADAYTWTLKHIVADQDGLTRRQILRGAIGGAAGIALGAPVRRLAGASAQRTNEAARLGRDTASESASTVRLSDDLFVVRLPGEANVIAHTGADGVLLVDGVSAAASDALMGVVAGLPRGGAVHTIFNTHWHPEQTGSNERLGKGGKTIIAHENTRLWLTTDVTWPWDGRRFDRLPRVAQPNKTFYTTGTLESPKEGRRGLPVDPKEGRRGLPVDPKEGRRGLPVDIVRYGHIPDAAHTDGDLYVYFPQQNVLGVGDVLAGDGWPAVDWATGGWIGGIVGGLQRLQTVANEQTRIVPARGPVLGYADLEAQAGMYATIYGRLTELLNKGRGPSEAVAAAPAKEFEAQMGNPDEFVRRAFESLWAYLSPDA
jgi:glyoxylase-like metal-dependent hydrolase (beta-lactamase superfamily II)